MKKRIIFLLLTSVMMTLSGCSGQITSDSSSSATSDTTAQTTSAVNASEMFTDRDMEIGYDENTSTAITLSGDSASCDLDSVQISENTITITEEGVYILSGTLDNGMIVVDAADTDKIRLVLNGADITNETSAAIYILEADKVFITSAPNSENVLANSGEYIAIDENNIDAVIFSKSDLTLNGSGTLTISAACGHGIVSKDDLVVTSGSYQINAASHGLSGKDSVRIANGDFTIVSGKDGIHAENADDTSLGFIYIADGSFTISSGDDGMHADNALTISGGNINILQSYEGIEGLSIDITGGDITLTSDDDGLNCAGGNDSSGFGGHGDDIFSATEGAYIMISEGTLHINASGDGIDSNGSLTITGGETYVSGSTDNGNGALDYTSDGIIAGGILVAAGSSGMAQNLSSASTQGVMMVTVDTASAGSTISLTDDSGNELISWQPDKEYTCVIISCPEITQGSTYTLNADGYSTQITMDSLVYSSGGGIGNDSGGMGGGKNDGNMGGRHGDWR